ncbi:hypothetical protein [Natronosalvus caseinilyticus]|uniref:hypothetical protein n=1 Tax=Natronosalvus caseinilyticus TaxID=2953747 RepID=UPI0028AED3BC|nr:hypothetical protein [Natronosalvus caseinilyticus]
MTSNTLDERTTTRRRVLQSGTVGAASGLIGRVESADESETATERGPPRSDPVPAHGAMFSYQYAPGSRCSLVERELDWRPRALEQTYVTNVVTFHGSRSFRAFLFTDSDLPRRDRTITLGSPRRSGSTAARNVIDVELEFDEESAPASVNS